MRKAFLIALLWLSVFGCVWDIKPEIERDSHHLDRAVYSELTLDDLISIVSSQWPKTASDYCLHAASKITVVRSADLKQDCEKAWPCDACIYVIDLKIIIRADVALLDQYESIVHELGHFFSHCVDGDSDGEHLRKDVWLLRNSKSSVEAKSINVVWEETRSNKE